LNARPTAFEVVARSSPSGGPFGRIKSDRRTDGG
jgi:hypothetical protein